MRATVQRLEAFLTAHRPDVLTSMRPGLSHEALYDLQAPMGVSLPAPLRVFWQWRGGQAQMPSFLYNQHLLPPTEAIRSGKMLQEMWSTSPWWWGQGWIPLTHNGAGDHICIDTRGVAARHSKSGGKRGQIVDFRHDDAMRRVLAPSLEAWIEALIAVWTATAWTQNDTGFQPDDWRAHQQALRDRLPGYPIAYMVDAP